MPRLSAFAKREREKHGKKERAAWIMFSALWKLNWHAKIYARIAEAQPAPTFLMPLCVASLRRAVPVCPGTQSRVELLQFPLTLSDPYFGPFWSILMESFCRQREFCSEFKLDFKIKLLYSTATISKLLIVSVFFFYFCLTIHQIEIFVKIYYLNTISRGRLR